MKVHLSKNFKQRVAAIFPTFVFPLIVTILLSLVFWPGLMSYDSVHALQGAREGVSDSTWPPMVSYVWRLVDIFFPAPIAMLFSQVLLLMVSTASILNRYLGEKKFLYFSLLTMIAIPVHLGTVSVIWKDVLLAALALASVAMTLKLKNSRSSSQVILTSLAVCLLLIVATSVRHNAIFATGFLALFFCWTLAGRLKINRRQALTSAFSFLLLSSMVATKLFVDNYSLPDLKVISGTGEFSTTIMKLDLLGYSKCTGNNLTVGDKTFTLEVIKNGYDARHINLSAALANQISSGEPLERAWFKAAKSGSPCFLYQKAQNVYYSLGMNPGEQFLITAPEVYKNPYGYELGFSLWRTGAFAYEFFAQYLFFFRPYFIWAVTATILIWRRRELSQIKPVLVILLLAALSYAASQFLLGNASDARLLFFSNWTIAIIAAIGLFYRRSDSKNLD
jgi:hypothetical protein